MTTVNANTIRTAEHFGARLSARRESFGLTLSDMSELTNIGEDFLTAIETLDEGALPAIGYTLGFVRTYAKALGMDGDLAVKEYKADTALTKLPLRDAPHIVLTRHFRLPRGFVSAVSVASVALLIGVWYGTQSEAVATPTPLVEIAAQYTAAEPAMPVMQEGLFTLRTTSPSWIQIRDVAGTVEVSRIFTTGETWQGPTTAGYSVSVRDAGAVDLYDGTRLIGALGEVGEPISGMTLSRDLPTSERP
ncbi:MAG: RodZ domain-containing protein [Litorimonas sp.]